MVETPSRTYHILLGEDDPDDVVLMKTAIKKEALEIHLDIARNGVEVLTSLNEGASDRRPDLILLDLNMPIMTGLEALAKIRSNSDWQSIPVVILTSSQNPDDRERCEQAGANAYMVKPSSFGKLRSLVSEIFNTWFNN